MDIHIFYNVPMDKRKKHHEKSSFCIRYDFRIRNSLHRSLARLSDFGWRGIRCNSGGGSMRTITGIVLFLLGIGTIVLSVELQAVQLAAAGLALCAFSAIVLIRR